MDRNAFNRGVVDFSVGVFGGILFKLSKIAATVVAIIAVLVLFIMALKGGDISSYGNDKEGNFHIDVVVVRMITVFVGTALGQAFMATAFGG